jgi:hypothetical protein
MNELQFLIDEALINKEYARASGLIMAIVVSEPDIKVMAENAEITLNAFKEANKILGK